MWRGLRDCESGLRRGSAREYRSPRRRSADCRFVDSHRWCCRSNSGGEPRFHIARQCDASCLPGCFRSDLGNDRAGNLVDRCPGFRPKAHYPARSLGSPVALLHPPKVAAPVLIIQPIRHLTKWRVRKSKVVAPLNQTALSRKGAYMVGTAYRIEHEPKERRFHQIIGNSPSLQQVLEQVELVAPTDASVLILGETGTGKELIARAIHNASARHGRPFIKVNCAAIPLGLLESELFGHEKGAFTGAIAQRLGRFEMADKGTIFLDEIGDIPLALQPKLLRVLQEREFERVGSCRTQKADVRLVAATHRDISEMVQNEQFRSDLYYRLNVFPVRLPALRERREDIALLVRHFVEMLSKRMGKVINDIPEETLSALASYSWPGNIRELQNVIERAVVLSQGEMLTVDLAELKTDDNANCAQEDRASLDDILHHAERTHILRALESANGVVAGPNGAAARLRIKRSTLLSRMQKLGIAASRNWIAPGQPQANWRESYAAG